MCRFKTTSYIWATLVCGLFMAEAIVFTVRANDPVYEKELIDHAKKIDEYHRYNDAQHGVPAVPGECLDVMEVVAIEECCSGHNH